MKRKRRDRQRSLKSPRKRSDAKILKGKGLPVSKEMQPEAKYANFSKRESVQRYVQNY